MFGYGTRKLRTKRKTQKSEDLSYTKRRETLVIQNAKRMRRIMSSELSASATFSSTLSQKDTILGKKVELKKCASIFSTISVETFLTLRRTERLIIKNALGLHVKYRLFLSDFNVN